MTTVNRSAINKLLWVGVRSVFGLSYKEIPEEYPMVFEVRNSTQAWEEDVLMTGTGYAGVKGEGESVLYDTMRNSWKARFDHETLGIALRITAEAIEDNQYFKFAAKGGKALARSMKLTNDLRAVNVINYGTDGGHLYGDGKPLLATDHPLSGLAGGTAANTLAVQADLSEAALEELLILADNAVDDRGLPIRLTPKRFVCSNSQRFNITRLLRSTGRVNTPDNDINAVREQGIFSGDPVMLRHLTNPNAWGFTTDGHDGGLIFYKRRELTMGEDTDFDTDDFKIKVTCRNSMGCADWRGYYGVLPT
jgi:hypothetical protein